MSKSNAFETSLLEHVLQNADIANIGDAAGLQNSAAAGSLYVRLFSADPGEAGAITNELTYTGYAAVAVARSAAGWTVSGANGSNAAAVTFGQCTGAGPQTAAYFGVCKTAAGDDMIYSGQVTTPSGGLVINSGVTPEFAIGALDINEE
jgi:hypothetical protein